MRKAALILYIVLSSLVGPLQANSAAISGVSVSIDLGEALTSLIDLWRSRMELSDVQQQERIRNSVYQIVKQLAILSGLNKQQAVTIVGIKGDHVSVSEAKILASRNQEMLDIVASIKENVEFVEPGWASENIAIMITISGALSGKGEYLERTALYYGQCTKEDYIKQLEWRQERERRYTYEEIESLCQGEEDVIPVRDERLIDYLASRYEHEALMFEELAYELERLLE